VQRVGGVIKNSLSLRENVLIVEILIIRIIKLHKKSGALITSSLKKDLVEDTKEGPKIVSPSTSVEQVSIII